ncbi:MAG: hypothetical protein HYV13_02865 [Candidatus Doudnabacteria bacterium]|nr:hypothetical protein [Candidatus Doudnabacteria bacterium]
MIQIVIFGSAALALAGLGYFVVRDLIAPRLERFGDTILNMLRAIGSLH